MLDEWTTTLIIVASGVFGLIFALYAYLQVAKIKITSTSGSSKPHESLLDAGLTEETSEKLVSISKAISDGAVSFLFAEYKYMAVFIILFSVVVYLAAGRDMNSLFAAISFVVGGVSSIAAGWIGMRIATFANVRTAFEARRGYPTAFRTAIYAGAVAGFALVSIGILVLFGLIKLYAVKFDDVEILYENIAGFGLGGSSIALFGRVGGGIYTKAADVGADLVGKVESGIPEDDPRNPAVIADNVGDNVGDVAGMSSDLFGSFGEATCAALVVAASSPELRAAPVSLMYPLIISAIGVFAGIFTIFIMNAVRPVHKEADIESALKIALVVSTVLCTPAVYGASMAFLPEEFTFPIAGSLDVHTAKNYYAFFCVAAGLWAGLLIGFVTEYFTSHSYAPVRDVAKSANTGAATLIIYGLALGYKSTIIPTLALAVVTYMSFSLCHMYGVGLAALGMLATMSIGLTIDVYGPVTDNAGGIAEMAGLGEDVRERTDALDAAGNTTAAIGKGFAIGSAALVSLALFGAFTTKTGIVAVDLLQPYDFAGLLVGSMLPYAFSAMVMKSVGKAALDMVEEVRFQFREMPGIMTGAEQPNYTRCIQISTDASLREMILPGFLVMGTPIVVGFFFGNHAVCGVLAGSLVSSVQMAISSSNTGGAWDNAKKYIEKGNFGGKNSTQHHAAIVGDTVGDPLKDTSGPALNILMKLAAVESLVLSKAFVGKLA